VTPEEEERKNRAKEARLLRAAEARNKVIVGIDFGTTYSGSANSAPVRNCLTRIGIAYGSTTRPWNEVVVISRWTGGQNDIQEKVPTRIAYAHENNFRNDRWGYDVKAGMKSAQWFKLLLDDNTRASDFDDPQLEQSIGTTLMRLPEGKVAQEVASDFLSMLYNHTIVSLEDLIGETALEQTAIIFSITTPATWSLAARHATRTAAENAGFGSRDRDEVILTDEPEAAAISALKSVVTTFDAKPFQVC
jgi:hypothetical protein